MTLLIRHCISIGLHNGIYACENPYAHHSIVSCHILRVLASFLPHTYTEGGFKNVPPSSHMCIFIQSIHSASPHAYTEGGLKT